MHVTHILGVQVHGALPDRRGLMNNCIGCASNREEDVRRFVVAGVLDACFVRSREDREAHLGAGGEKFRVTGIDMDELNPVGKYGSGSPSQLVLADGSTCDAASGAGPRGAQCLPCWNGECRGVTEGIWCSGGVNEGSGKHAVLNPELGANGVCQVAVCVGAETSKPAMVDVAKATYWAAP